MIVSSFDNADRVTPWKAAFRTSSLLVLATGIFVSVLGYALITNEVREDVKIRFNALADRQVRQIQGRLERHIQTVHSLGGLFDASDVVSRREFSVFAQQAISRADGVQALSWNPRVPRDSLPGLRRLARREGLGEFDFYERDDSGKRRPLGLRQDYVPVFYIEPVAGNEPALGFDVGSNTARRAALDQARDSGKAIATAAITLVQEAGKQPGILVFRPVYINGQQPKTQAARRQSIKGYAVGVYRIGDILSSALGAGDGRQTSLAIYDEIAGGFSEQPLYAWRNSSAESSSAVRAEIESGELYFESFIGVAERRWKIVVRPAVSFQENAGGIARWGFLFAGLLLTLVSFWFTVSMQTRALTVERRVKERTDELIREAGNRATAQEALEASEAKYRSLIEFFPLGALLSERGIITQVNAAGLRLHGAESEADLVGQEWMELVAPSYHDIIAGRRDAMQAGNNVEPIEMLMKRIDGTTFWGLCQAMPIQATGQSFYLTVFEDITDRKQAADELQRANRELVRSNDELAQFAYVASHDLKEPLRMVSSYCDLIADRYADKLDDTGRKFIHYATDGAKRMQVLIDDLLIYSRIGRGGEPEEIIDLNTVVDDVRRNLSAAIQDSGADLVVDELPKISGYRTELIRLFQNLIENSIKFRSDEPLRIEIGGARDSERLIVSVSDNGIGIPSEFHKRIFGVFQRLHGRDSYEGTGIGLAICQKIVSQMGGRIWVQASENGGCTFRFTIPDDK